MKKIRLIYHDDYWCNLTTVFLEPIWDRYFECVPLSCAGAVNKHTDIMYANFLTADKWISSWKQDGFKIVVDHLWDSWVDDSWESHDNVLVIRNANWSWYNESLWYDFLGYKQYRPNKKPRKYFLLQMNAKKPHRDILFERLEYMLENSIYSYHGRGIPLQYGNDIPVNDTTWQRYIDPDWYDSTHFSVVVESGLETIPMIAHSEKSYKPMAFRHPTVTWGSAGLLEYLRSQGFESFSHRINEKYDCLIDDQQRLSAVVDEIKRVVIELDTDPSYFADSGTQEILDHNRNHFYDHRLVCARFDREIIDPILEFLQT